MLYAAVGLGLSLLVLGALALLRSTHTSERGDYVAPNVLTRINAEYTEQRH